MLEDGPGPRSEGPDADATAAEEGRPPDQVDDARRADEKHLRELQRARQGRVAKVVVALAIAVILIIFIIANSQGVRVSFVFFHRNPPLIWVMLACAVLGGIVGYMIGRPSKHARLHQDDGKHAREH